MKKIAVSLAFLLLLLTVHFGGQAQAAVAGQDLTAAIQDTAAYMQRTVSEPQVGSVGGEWAVLGLARSGQIVPDAYYQNYYAAVEAYVKACAGQLHDVKYTEYSRLILALTAIGQDARDVAGYNLLTALGDYDKTIWQGLNGPIWALIALDSGDYELPQNKEAATQATRDLYIQRILACQLADGGFSLFGSTPAAASTDNSSDPDITAMALQALAKYQDRADVKKVTEEALARLSEMQDADGGYSSWGSVNSESVVQVLVALCELGIDLDDARFVKNGHTVLDNLMTFYRPGGGFLHTGGGGGSNQMASEQALYGLVAAQRARVGQPSLYRITDAVGFVAAPSSAPQAGAGLSGKHADVQAQPVVEAGKTFADISGASPHKNQAAIEALAARGIISGKSETSFDPEGEMTRAEFAAIVVRALGLKPQSNAQFQDVAPAAWYAPYVGTAYQYGIITGVRSDRFDPQGKITKEAAAVMVARAAKLCGMETGLDTLTIRDLLAPFGDYLQSSQWAREALAFCYQENILDAAELEIRPQDAIKRAEIAQMLFQLLGSANLL